ncbi:uncharacterized protein PSFLO_03064 [Pseudozyma flocculosa]|uniref:Uncharacterized protein n=1 Tax=Pseudozyma flocculosa TaxID=84751 RepID=A0A5C3F2D0_9BASI|nr:uncharacterized protein PSFLO_03064 [Pseudozyma flocculosa]
MSLELPVQGPTGRAAAPAAVLPLPPPPRLRAFSPLLQGSSSLGPDGQDSISGKPDLTVRIPMPSPHAAVLTAGRSASSSAVDVAATSDRVDSRQASCNPLHPACCAAVSFVLRPACLPPEAGRPGWGGARLSPGLAWPRDPAGFPGLKFDPALASTSGSFPPSSTTLGPGQACAGSMRAPSALPCLAPIARHPAGQSHPEGDSFA